MILESSANRCFVCGPANNNGLKVRFRLENDGSCRAEWSSSASYIGYEGVTHGGILFCLLDDVMANLLFLKDEVCVTAKADIRFHNPLGIGEKIQLQSNLVRRRGRLAIIEADARRDGDGELIASSTGHFIVTGVARKPV